MESSNLTHQSQSQTPVEVVEPLSIDSDDDYIWTDTDFMLADGAEYLISTPNKKGEITYEIYEPSLADCACQRYQPVTYGGILYIYDRFTLTYRPESREISAWVDRQVRHQIEDTQQLPRSVGQKLKSLKERIGDICSDYHPLPSTAYPFDQINGYPVNNGVIVWDEHGTPSLIPHSVDHLITRKSPINYNPYARTDLAERVLKSWLPEVDEDGNELWQYLLQIPAQAIVQSLPGRTPYKKAYMLLGAKNSGKSTYNEVCRQLFGDNNVATRALQDFDGSKQFAAGDLVGKYINFGDDLTQLTVKSGNQFKTLVGLSKMTVEHKHRDTYIAPITAVHAYSANHLPKLDTDIYSDDAWWSRWIIISFNQRFDVDPNWSRDTLTTEFYEGLLLLVVRYVGRMIKTRGLPLNQPWLDVKTVWVSGESKFDMWFDSTFSLCEVNYTPIDITQALESLHTWAMEYMPVDAFVAKQGTDAIHQWRKGERNLMPTTNKMLIRSMRTIEGIDTIRVTTGYKTNNLGEYIVGDDGRKIPIRKECFRGLRWRNAPWVPGEHTNSYNPEITSAEAQ